MAIYINPVPQTNVFSELTKAIIPYLVQRDLMVRQEKAGAKQAEDDRFYPAHSSWRAGEFIAERDNPIFNPDKEAMYKSLDALNSAKGANISPTARNIPALLANFGQEATISKTFSPTQSPENKFIDTPKNITEFLNKYVNQLDTTPHYSKEPVVLAPKQPQDLSAFLNNYTRDKIEVSDDETSSGAFGFGVKPIDEGWLETARTSPDKSKWTPNWQITNDLTKEDIRRKYEEGDDKLRFRKPADELGDELKRAQIWNLRNPRSSGGGNGEKELVFINSARTNSVRAFELARKAREDDNEELAQRYEAMGIQWEERASEVERRYFGFEMPSQPPAPKVAAEAMIDKPAAAKRMATMPDALDESYITTLPKGMIGDVPVAIDEPRGVYIDLKTRKVIAKIGKR